MATITHTTFACDRCGANLGDKRKSRGFQKPAGVEFDWSSGRYRRVDLWQPLSSGDEHD